MQYQFTKYERGALAAGMGSELPLVQRNTKPDQMPEVKIEHNYLADLNY